MTRFRLNSALAGWDPAESDLAMLNLTNLGLDRLSRTESALADSGLADYIIGALRAPFSRRASREHIVLCGQPNSRHPRTVRSTGSVLAGSVLAE